jgi:hypothetical protein
MVYALLRCDSMKDLEAITLILVTLTLYLVFHVVGLYFVTGEKNP